MRDANGLEPDIASEAGLADGGGSGFGAGPLFGALQGPGTNARTAAAPMPPAMLAEDLSIECPSPSA